MNDKEFEEELERRFDALFLQSRANWIVYQEAERVNRELEAKMYAAAALLWGNKADEFIKGYPVNGKPHLKKA